MKLLAAAALATGLMMTGAASAATNLIANGSFELGADGLDSWKLTSVGSGTGYSPTVVIATDGVARGYPAGAFGEGVPADTIIGGSPDAAGGQAAYFSSDVGSETLSQTLSLAAGKYNVGFDAYLPLNGFDNPKDATFTAAVGGFIWDPVELKEGAGAPKVWTHYSGVVDVGAGGGLTTFAFAADGFPAVDVLIDRVYVTAVDGVSTTTVGVPEPATWGLMLVGFGGMGAMLRSRRRQATATA